MTRFRIDGLDDLRAALRDLPDRLAGEAGHLVEANGNAAAVEIRTAYLAHRRSGNLADHVTAERQSTGRGAALVVIRSAARHAAIFEYGTQARHTDLGANRGSMPAAHAFVPVVQRRRRALMQSLIGLLEREGLAVRGDEF